MKSGVIFWIVTLIRLLLKLRALSCWILPLFRLFPELGALSFCIVTLIRSFRFMRALSFRIVTLISIPRFIQALSFCILPLVQQKSGNRALSRDSSMISDNKKDSHRFHSAFLDLPLIYNTSKSRFSYPIDFSLF